MGICGRKPVSAIVCALGLSAVPLSGAHEAPLSLRCPFVIRSEPELALINDPKAPQPFCLYFDASGQVTPFVNAVTVVSREGLADFRVNGDQLGDLGFFRFAPQPQYLGRPSYSDSRNGYAQQALKTIDKSQRRVGDVLNIAVQIEMRVTWIKPAEGKALSEVTDTYSCVDAATVDPKRITVLNWCVAKGSPFESKLMELGRSLQSVRQESHGHQ
jgi:hypothetical protein